MQNIFYKINSLLDIEVPHKHLEEVLSYLNKNYPIQQDLINKTQKKIYSTLINNLQFDEKYLGDSLPQMYGRYEKDSIPLEYKTHNIHFDDITLDVYNNSLIPRRKTNLDEYVVKYAYDNPDNYNYIDLGTGTGIIGIKTLKEKSHLFRQSQLLDIQHTNILLAEKNCKINIPDVNIEFYASDLFQNCQLISGEKYIISANLPYSSSKEIENFSSFIKAEGETSLYGGEDDGLTIYKDFFNEICSLKSQGIMFPYIIIECSRSNHNIMEEWLKNYDLSQNYVIEKKPDWFGIMRNISLTYK